MTFALIIYWHIQLWIFLSAPTFIPANTFLSTIRPLSPLLLFPFLYSDFSISAYLKVTLKVARKWHEIKSKKPHAVSFSLQVHPPFKEAVYATHPGALGIAEKTTVCVSLASGCTHSSGDDMAFSDICNCVKHSSFLSPQIVPLDSHCLFPFFSSPLWVIYGHLF